MEWGSRDQVADVARVVADMGIDLWCLAHADRDYVASLREHLAADFGLDYGCHHEPAGSHPALAFLHRRSKAMTLDRSPWGIELPEGVALPPLITVRASTKRTGTVAFQLVAVGRPTSPEALPTPYAEAVRHAIRRGHGEFDWIVVGEAPVLLAPEKLQVLADCDRELLAAAADRDGAVALLTGPRSKVAQVFVSPNLLPAFGVPETLTVTRDRDLPSIFRTLGVNQPIALRLALDSDPRPPFVRQSRVDLPRPSPTLPPHQPRRRPRAPGPRHDHADPGKAPRGGPTKARELMDDRMPPRPGRGWFLNGGGDRIIP